MRTPLPFLGGLLLVYLGVPVVAFVVRLAATHDRGFHDAGLFPALATSATAATVSMVVVTLLGVPLAYLLAHARGRLASACGVAVQLPLALPPVMSGILLIYLVGPYTALGRFFDGALTESLVGIVLAQSFVAAPFLVVTARAAFGAVDPALEDVAATLGHGTLGRFLRVAVPAAAPGVRAGMVLAWLRAFGEYGATVVLAYHPTSLPVYTFTQFSATGLPGTMAPTALALGVAAVCVALARVVLVPVLRVRRHRRRHRVRAGGGAGGVAAPASAVPAPAVPAPVAPGPGPLPPVAPATGSSAPPVVPTPVSFDLDVVVGHRDGFHLRVAHTGTTGNLAVLGPSGSGKSTLLRCLAGLYGGVPGTVRIGERAVTDVPSGRRRVGYVAQGFGLFPHLRVWEQLVFARGADPALAHHWLERMRLSGLEDRYPSELSGGQRQRVALAQALTRAPDVLLLDEPLSALDTPVRRELREELRRLQRETGVSTVVVTHDPEEAAFLAGEVLVVAEGRALQQGPVRAVYGGPSSFEVARLLGLPNVHPGVVAGPGHVTVGTTPLPARTGDLAPGAPVVWSVAPEDVRVDALGSSAHATAGIDQAVARVATAGREAPAGTALRGTVEDVADLGTGVSIRVRLGPELVLEARRRAGPGGPGALAPGGLATGASCTVTLADAVAWPARAPAGSEEAGSPPVPRDPPGRVTPVVGPPR